MCIVTYSGVGYELTIKYRSVSTKIIMTLNNRRVYYFLVNYCNYLWSLVINSFIFGLLRWDIHCMSFFRVDGSAGSFGCISFTSAEDACTCIEFNLNDCIYALSITPQSTKNNEKLFSNSTTSLSFSWLRVIDDARCTCREMRDRHNRYTGFYAFLNFNGYLKMSKLIYSATQLGLINFWLETM